MVGSLGTPIKSSNLPEASRAGPAIAAIPPGPFPFYPGRLHRDSSLGGASDRKMPVNLPPDRDSEEWTFPPIPDPSRSGPPKAVDEPIPPALRDRLTLVSPGLLVRLFEISWTNHHPEKPIASLDFLSKGNECDPFLVALILERD